MSLHRTALFQWHVDHGGRMVPFAGWEMPVQYPTGPIEEHHITRRSAGLFDIDHMGRVSITGPDAVAYLNHLVTWDVSTMAENDAHYALMCYETGGIVDDVFIYRLPAHWMVVVNADNRTKDVAWMQQQAADYDVVVTDISDATYMLALQGPNALLLLQRLTDTNVMDVPRFTALEAPVTGLPVIIGRTGYTGEDGVELFFETEHARTIWSTILSEGSTEGIEVAPIGLAARDSLRFEPGFALYGHEIAEHITPIEARLSWACSFDKAFIGRDALLAQKDAGVTKKLIAFELTERGVPRQGYSVANADGGEIGEVVSGLFAPTVEKYCGHAFVSPAYAKIGTPLQIMVRGKPKAAVVVKRPFYKPTYR